MHRLKITSLLLICMIVISHSLLSACTIAAISGDVTVNGKPILWKNRDVGARSQTIALFKDGEYDYITVIYTGQSTKAWAGINEKGFAIINSDSYNLGLWPRSGPDDGVMMKMALQSCATVDEFQVLLDSTNVTGRATAANYGVFDSTGMVSMFEAAPYCYERFDASDAPNGYLVRANFSISGDPDNQPGLNRYMRARGLIRDGMYGNELDHKYIIQKVSRDMGQLEFDPYPLPYEGCYEGLPYGYLSTSTTINRYYSSSVEVIVGNLPHQDPKLGTLWAMLGEPITAIPIPLWVYADSIPPEINNFTSSPLWNEAGEIEEIVYTGTCYRCVNTFTLAEIMDYFSLVEDWVFACADVMLEAWDRSVPRKEIFSNIQDIFAERVYEYYIAYTPLSTWNDKPPLPDKMSLNAYPNPFNAKCQISVEIPVSTSIVITIYDLLGEEVHRIENDYVESGLHLFEWVPEEEATGFYFIKTSSPIDNSLTKVLYIK
ncbi:T9SS type A sorting domain-containing protein [bacterium]|nr:T9SS type A sorting domain-containing protein [bacterium]